MAGRSTQQKDRKGVTGEGGLTLIELMVTLAVLAILLAVTAPIFSQIRQVYNLRGAAREIFSELQKARMAAVMENNRYRFSLVDSYNYKIHDDNDNDGAEDAGETVTTKNIQTDSPGVTLSATNTVTFIPNGTASTYGTITLTNTSGSKSVVVSSAGRIRIQ